MSTRNRYSKYLGDNVIKKQPVNEEPVEQIEEKNIDLEVENQQENVEEVSEEINYFIEQNDENDQEIVSSKPVIKSTSKNDYFNIVNNYKDSIKVVEEEKPKAVYNFSKKNGEVVVEPKNPTYNEEKPEKEENVDKREEVMDELYDKYYEDYLSITVEVQVHKEMIKTERDQSKVKLYNKKLERLLEDLSYYKRKLEALDKMKRD